MLMHDVDVVLDVGVAGLGVHRVGPGLRVPAGEAEGAGAPDDGHLPDFGEREVAAEHGERAAVVGAGGEHEVHDLQEAHCCLVRPYVDALGPSHGR
uniref:Uncharacterized protein n=1 Tax=Triticum urartu TaxID=4572 RepID=A0A8R7Q376_TRIUA